ncbi:ABC transporter permease subunit [Burkholderia cepacia]|uniref:ABC transporter permease subunit n=1 Tax=Burkholderia cepacia TaxID=292 RepID=UPI002AB79C41|nr:ABC transporter permease subunit [Burkholderia cepacia]
MRRIARIRVPIIVASFALWIACDPGWSGLLASGDYLLRGMATTFVYSLAGVGLGLIAGAVLAAMRLAGGVLSKIAATGVALGQAVPPLFVIAATYLLMPELLQVRPSPEIAGVVSLGLIASGYYCEAFRAAVAGVDPLLAQAARVSGLSRGDVLGRIVIPQALVACVPAVGASSIIVFKLSTLVYPIGITDFFRATVIVNNRIIEPVRCYALIAAFYYVASDLIEQAVRWSSQRLGGGTRGAASRIEIPALSGSAN